MVLSSSAQRPSTAPRSRRSLVMPCQSKLSTRSGAPPRRRRARRTPSAKCSDSSSSSLRCAPPRVHTSSGLRRHHAPCMAAVTQCGTHLVSAHVVPSMDAVLGTRPSTRTSCAWAPLDLLRLPCHMQSMPYMRAHKRATLCLFAHTRRPSAHPHDQALEQTAGPHSRRGEPLRCAPACCSAAGSRM